MSQRDTQVNIKLTQKTLDEWDRYIEEESSFTTRSEFVRFAVNREVNQRHEPDQGIIGENQALLQEIRDTVVGLSDRMDRIESQVDTLQTAVRSDPEIEELANEIFSLLPDKEPGTRKWREELRNREDQAQAESDEEYHKRAKAWRGRPEALAEAFNEPERKIRSAIGLLMTETHLVRSKKSGGDTRYWKDV